MAELELYTKEPGKFADEVLKHLDLEVEIEPMHEAPEHLRKGTCRNWSILAAADPVSEVMTAGQILFSNMDYTSKIKAICVRNVIDNMDPGISVVVTYVESGTEAEREFMLNDWGTRRSFGSVITSKDSEEDGLAENHPPQIKRFGDALTRGDTTVAALRNFINDCTR